MADSYTPAQTGFSRVFIQKFGARADRLTNYHSCMKLGALEQSYGDITKIECPHPTRPNEFIEVGSISGETERPTTSLMGRYPANEASLLKELADLGCENDGYVNIGLCKDVSLANVFTKRLTLEALKITNYATDEIGALSSDERAAINETADTSMRRWYEVLPLKFTAKAGDLVTNEVVDIIIADVAQCGSCDEPSDGCQKIFALTLSAGGSPSTPADIVYSLDKGLTWYAVDIDTLGAAENPSALAAVGEYLVVVSNASNSLHYALLSDFDTVPVVTWTEVSTGFVTAKEPNDIWSVGNTAFIAADGGYIYKVTDPASGVEVLYAGTDVTDDLQAVAAVDEENFVAVGNAGAVLKSENGSTVTPVTPRPVGVGVNLTCVDVKDNNRDEWFVGGSNGNYYYTVNGGTTWATGAFNGSGSGQVDAIEFATKSVGYLAHRTSANVGRLFRTYDGGKSWVLCPDQSKDTLPANDRLNALATCGYADPNFVVGGGLGDNGSDGIVLIGMD